MRRLSARIAQQKVFDQCDCVGHGLNSPLGHNISRSPDSDLAVIHDGAEPERRPGSRRRVVPPHPSRGRVTLGDSIVSSAFRATGSPLIARTTRRLWMTSSTASSCPVTGGSRLPGEVAGEVRREGAAQLVSRMAYSSGPSRGTAGSGAAITGPVTNCAVDADVRGAIAAPRRRAAVSRCSGPYSPASST
jgi:hypothetical protein